MYFNERGRDLGEIVALQKRSSDVSYKRRGGNLAPNLTTWDDIFFPKLSRIALQKYFGFPPSPWHPFRLFLGGGG